MSRSPSLLSIIFLTGRMVLDVKQVPKLPLLDYTCVRGRPMRYRRPLCCGIFHCVWNISASAGSTNNQDCTFHFFRFISFVHSYITIVLNVLLKITMLTSFMVTTSKRLNYVCPAANRTWQRLTIISCDLKHERDTYFLNISHIIYLNYYLPRINRLQSKPLRLIKTNRINSIIPS